LRGIGQFPRESSSLTILRDAFPKPHERPVDLSNSLIGDSQRIFSCIVDEGRQAPDYNQDHMGKWCLLRMLPAFRLVVFAVVVCTWAPVLAGKQTIRESAAPTQVIEAIHRKYPTAARLHWKQEKDGWTIFEVRLNDKGRRLVVVLTAAGAFLEEREPLVFANLPQQIRRAVWAHCRARGRCRPSFAARVVTREKSSDPRYVVGCACEDPRQHAEFTFDKQGRLRTTLQQ
jgi:hypothetical protein